MIEARAAEAADNDLKVLVPEIVTWTGGDQAFGQSPATLDTLADILDIIVDEVLSSGNSEMLDKLLSTATSATTDDKDKDKEEDADGEKETKSVVASLAADRELITGLVRIIATLPRSLPKISAAIVTQPEGVDIDMESYFRKNLRPREAFGILRTFIKQNDVGSIIRDFSELFQEFQTEMAPDESSKD